jgi:hypothetical protein
LNSDERLSMDERFQQIAETRRPNSLEWLAGHRERMDRMRLEPDYAAYQSELLRAKLEDLSMTMHALIARLNPNGQRGFGHVGPPPQPKAQGKS